MKVIYGRSVQKKWWRPRYVNLARFIGEDCKWTIHYFAWLRFFIVFYEA